MAVIIAYKAVIETTITEPIEPLIEPEEEDDIEEEE